jgi:trehalose 6-phosphate phosphatase
LADLKYLFHHLDEFERFKKDEKTTVVTDIDGTISEIVDIPGDAVVSPLMKEILKKLTKKFKLIAVVSGRSIKNIKNMIGIDEILYIGNHGMEISKNGKIMVSEDVKKYLPIVKEVTKKIQEDKSCQIDNIMFEEKGICSTIHYRLCEDPDEARKVIINALSNIEEAKDLKIAEGRKVIEIKPKIEQNKGTVLEKIIKDYNIQKVIYLGDDVTDADAFNRLKELKNNGKVDGEGIVVISQEIPEFVKENASYYVESVGEVQKFFNWLLEDD